MKRMTLLILVFPLACIAQEFNFVFEPDSIPVEIDGWQPFCPWVGGMSESNPAIVDIDGDEDLDFFIGEFFGYIRYFQNNGDAISPNFSFITAQFDSIHLEEARANPCFRDLDSDGDLDLVVGDTDSHVHFYRNVGTPESPRFNYEGEMIPYVPPYGLAPELVDIDADGDYDLFQSWETVLFYLNEGTPDSFDFNLVTSNFEEIEVSRNASVDFVDIDSDGDYDMFIGEYYGKIWYYRNDGDSVNYDFTYVTNYFDSIDVGDYASPEFTDIDGDGDFDLFVGREGNYSNPYGDVYYYENIGTPTNPQFEYVTKNYLTMDLSYHTTIPQIVDINGNGTLDLIVGTARTLHYFENTGTTNYPSFIFVDDNFQGITIIEMHPFFVDIDDDGDYDLLCGESAIPGPSNLALYINQGTPEVPNLVLYDPVFISNPDFFVNIQPSCADIDGDGDYDLFITDDDGHYFYYRNDGTQQWPDFTLVTNQWQGISFSNEGWRGMSFSDIDGDQDLDLLTLNEYYYTEDSNLRFYRNIGTPEVANMYMETNTFLPGYVYRACPYVVDIDIDGDLDIFCGTGDGGIMFFRNLSDSNSVSEKYQIQPFTFTLHQNYPNPFNPTTVIPFTLDRALPVRMVVYNGLGQCVVTLIDGQMLPGQHQLRWDAGMYSSGVYLVSLESDMGFQQARKVMLIK